MKGKRPGKSGKVAICPACLTEYPERDAAKEPVYVCVDCGKKGYDCCVPGNNALCFDCENRE